MLKIGFAHDAQQAYAAASPLCPQTCEPQCDTHFRCVVDNNEKDIWLAHGVVTALRCSVWSFD